MFRETITHAGGITEGSASEAHARYLLRRAVNRGYDVEATEAGGAVITWTVRRLGPGGGNVIEEPRSIALAPLAPAGALTGRTVEDLEAIHASNRARYAEHDGRRVIVAGFFRVPPMATARLRARSLVTEDPDRRVRLTLAARLALLARAHRTRTTEPRGWQRPADIGLDSAGLNRPGRRNGLVYDRISAVLCSCGQLAAHGDGRDDARRLATQHRREAAAAFIVAELTP
ncbi:hypothetical protein PH213_20445 [Streptomyces sp. SRF1]|uniref:hypothetical protein n=1 Tax=Streptomyces sp. SRF1 TaxID=1549642 RepID=UPI0025B1C117|nr:hypothetical protein [Streptomyces sp. SRF1]MDN3056877.1 hypothetical protein [Streptomyces sp. SRF1]